MNKHSFSTNKPGFSRKELTSANERSSSPNELSSSPNRKGFTLIELLVTIAIIAILSTVGMVVFSTAQKNARVSKRVQDLKAINTAIVIFKSANGKYPIQADTFACINSLTGVNSITPTYMALIPDDPVSSYCYEYRSDDGNEYKLRNDSDICCSEMKESDFEKQPSLIDPSRDGGDGSAPNPCTIEAGTRNGWAYYSSGACGWY